MEDLTKLSYKEVMQRLIAARSNNIQIVKNEFGFIWPDNDLYPHELVRGRLFIFDGKNFAGISEKDNISRRYVSFSEDFIVVRNCYNDLYEIYVSGNKNNILNKLRPEVRDDFYEININYGIMLLYSDTRLIAVSKTGHLKQLDKGPQGDKKYYVIPSKKVRFAYDIYKNSKLLTTVDLNLQPV